MKNTLEFLVTSKNENLNSVRFYLEDFDIDQGVLSSYSLTPDPARAARVTNETLREFLTKEITSEQSDGESVSVCQPELIGALVF